MSPTLDSFVAGSRTLRFSEASILQIHYSLGPSVVRSQGRKYRYMYDGNIRRSGVGTHTSPHSGRPMEATRMESRGYSDGITVPCVSAWLLLRNHGAVRAWVSA